MVICDLLGLAKVDGEIGIEIEVEGKRLPDKYATKSRTKSWKAEIDGSLKAEEAFEYVLINPVYYEQVGGCLQELEDMFAYYESKRFESIRAGVHVHINVQQLTIKQLATLLTCYMVVENILIDYCGESRKGNLFCLRTSDAKALTSYILSVLKSKKFNAFANNDYRYASVNIKSIADYGSLEFRSMRSTPDMCAIKTWVDLLYSLFQNSLDFEDPRDVLAAVSGQGYMQFIKRMFGELWVVLPIKDTFEDDIYDGICNAQDLAFGIKWDKYSPINNNPFK